MIDFDLAVTLLEFNGWESFGDSCYKKGASSIQIGSRMVGIFLQNYDGFGWGDIREVESVCDFATALAEIRSDTNELAIDALSEVADRLNSSIVSAFGDGGGWDDHAGYDKIPEGLTIDPGASHRETLEQLWKLREDINSVLAGMV